MPERLSLTSAQVAAVVDSGANADAAVRAHLVLEQVLLDHELDALPTASSAARDGWLLAVRRQTFGELLPARLHCPACGSQLAVDVPAGDIPLSTPSLDPARSVRVERGGTVVEAQVPDGAALSAAAACRDIASARSVLVERCLRRVEVDGTQVEPSALDEETVAAVGEAIVAAEPGVEPSLEVTCATCEETWSPVIDLAQFFWRELTAAGSQLLDEVHELATAYGWSEDEILRLSSRRRRDYVQRLHRD